LDVQYTENGEFLLVNRKFMIGRLQFDNRLDMLLNSTNQRCRRRGQLTHAGIAPDPDRQHVVEAGRPGQPRRAHPRDEREDPVLPGPVGDAAVIAHARKGDGGVERDPPAREQIVEEGVQFFANQKGFFVHQVSHLKNKKIKFDPEKNNI
jgi:hypothetical protein